MNIVYVEYDFAGQKGLGPWSAVEGKDGMFWIPYYGRGNEVVRLNPKTAELKRFPLPFEKTAGIHSAIPAPDGTVWFTEATLGGIGHLNPATDEITEYRDKTPDGRAIGKHTVRVDDPGQLWSSGGPISRFDPITKELSPLRHAWDLRQRCRKEWRPVVHSLQQRRPHRQDLQGREAVQVLSPYEGQTATPGTRR